MAVSWLLPLLTVTGELGHVEHYTLDVDRRVVRHCTYSGYSLLREFVVPLDVDAPGWGLSGTFIKVRSLCWMVCQGVGVLTPPGDIADPLLKRNKNC